MTGDPRSPQPMRTRLLSARLLLLLLKLRMSAALAYRNRTGFIEQQRRMLTLVGNYDGLTSVELVALTGTEKAQVSRTLATLGEAGLLERASLRAPIALTPAGRDAFDRIIALAETRNAELTQGLSPPQLARFAELTGRLTDRAKLLLAHERDVSQEPDESPRGGAELAPMPERLREGGGPRPLAAMAAPALITLVAFLQRSATVAFRRETGLSNFEWQVMSQVGEYAPVPLLRLIELIGRDKSQVGRTVKYLEGLGLVARAPAGGRSVTLDVTPKGAEIYARMCEIAIARDDFLLAEVTEADRAAYVAVVERLTANADRLLARERDTGGAIGAAPPD